MRYTPYRGLAQGTNWVELVIVALNLKTGDPPKKGSSLPFVLCRFYLFCGSGFHFCLIILHNYASDGSDRGDLSV